MGALLKSRSVILRHVWFCRGICQILRLAIIFDSCDRRKVVSIPVRYEREMHDDVIKWKQLPRYWPLCGELPVTSEFPSRGALMFSLICAWTHGWVNNRDAGDLRRHKHSLCRHCNGSSQTTRTMCEWSVRDGENWRKEYDESIPSHRY